MTSEPVAVCLKSGARAHCELLNVAPETKVSRHACRREQNDHAVLHALCVRSGAQKARLAAVSFERPARFGGTIGAHHWAHMLGNRGESGGGGGVDGQALCRPGLQTTKIRTTAPRPARALWR